MTSVLVVDDEPAIRAMLSSLLTAEGYSFQTAEHGGPALDIMRASLEHLLVTLGLVMPEVDGLEVLETVAADADLARRYAIVVVSAAVGLLRSGRGAELCRQLDVPLVPKPFTFEQLLDTIEEAEWRWAMRSSRQESHDGGNDDGCRCGVWGVTELTRPGGVTTIGADRPHTPHTPHTLYTPGIQGTLGGQGGQSGQNDDDDVRDLLDRAHVLMCQCKYEEALPLTQRAVELDPRGLKAWRELGTNYGDLGRVADLEQAFEQALSLAVTPEEEIETWYYRGHAENSADAWEAALRSFQQLAELAPDWCHPWLMRGTVLGNMGTFIDQRYHEEALVALEYAQMRARPRSVDMRIVYGMKAKSLFGLGRDEEAKYYDRKAKELWQTEQAASSQPRVVH